MFMASTSLFVLFLLLCYCQYFDKTFTVMLLVFHCRGWLYLGSSQVSVYRTIGPTLVYCCATAEILRKLLQQCFLFFIVVVIPGQ